MTFQFSGIARKISKKWIVQLPEEISQSFPSRGMLMATIKFLQRLETLVLEPDGHGSHWFEIQPKWFEDENGIVEMQSIHFCIEILEDWETPDIPEDFLKALIESGARDYWESLTTKAKWEWIRFIQSAAKRQTRANRIQVACDKLLKGDKRPCCFDASRCSVMDVSKSGKLLTK